MRFTQAAPKNLRAIGLMCAGVLFLVVNDAIGKKLVERFDPFQILFARSVVALPFVAILVYSSYGLEGFRSGRLLIHVFRALLAVVATYLFIKSLASLSLAEATSFIFTAPIFVAALSMPLLRQRVGIARLIAICTGFIGALIVLQPGTDRLHLASFLALGAAFLTAFIMISARWIDKGDRFWTMTFYMTLFSGVFCAFVLVTDWPAIGSGELLLLVTMAAAGTLGIALITEAFRTGDASAVAPFDYTALIWASLIGWIFWGSIPGLPVYLGAAIIAASSLYLVLKDAKSDG